MMVKITISFTFYNQIGFHFPQKINKFIKNKPVYRNPIYFTKEHNQMIDSGEVKNQSELVRNLNISRARITKILNLLKLDSEFIQRLEKFGDPLKSRIITEQMLRSHVNKSMQ